MMIPSMPSIALPTGPYDWHPERTPRALYNARLAALRGVMTERGITHAVVHGNGFDHGALAWLTHFTPKLGPAYALVPASDPLRLLFAGGPGMKPSAQRLTWVEDVAAIKSIEGDVKRWLGEMVAGEPVRLGLVEGASMLRGDWRKVQRAAGGQAHALDDEIDKARAQPSSAEIEAVARAHAIAALACETLSKLACPGADLRAAAIAMERAAYAAGAQDVRVRIGRRQGGPPTTLPDQPWPMTGPTQIVIAVRCDGAWAEARFVLGTSGH